MKTNRFMTILRMTTFAAALVALSAMGQGVTNTTAPDSMVLIPGGTHKGKGPDTGAYELKVRAFYMERHEVSKALWDEVYSWARANGYNFDNEGSGKAPDHPVQSINWYDAVKWCNARSEKEGRPVAYRVGDQPYRSGKDAGLSPNGLKVDFTVPGYRLPTDVEWEYAARGGERGKRFPWGDTIDHSKANYLGHPAGLSYDEGYEGYDKLHSKSGEPYTAPVGSYPANGYGIHDIMGNVWEWCWDWSPDAPNAHRTTRGGAWSYSGDYGRVASRSNVYPVHTYWSIGLRTVMAKSD